MRVCPKCDERYLGVEVFCPLDGTELVEVPDETEPWMEWDAPPTALIGVLLSDRYRVTEILGLGGMGIVYLARHETLDRDVAVKFLHEDLSKEMGTAQRFLIEARAAGRIEHENIIDIFDFGQDRRGRFYLVMEYARGEMLHSLLQREGPLAQERAIRFLRQILSALAAAHEANIVHRDLKPENMICSERGGRKDFIKILDFGLAKIIGDSVALTMPGLVMGTPEFMSPEQAGGEAIDARSDLYSAGIIAYEMLTGMLPFTGAPADVCIAHRTRELPRPSTARTDVEIHPDLERFVTTLLAKRPDDRYPSARTAEAVLDGIARQIEDEARSVGSVVDQTRAAIRLPSALPPAAPEGLADPQTRKAELPIGDFDDDDETVKWTGRDDVTEETEEEVRRLGALKRRRLQEMCELLWPPGNVPPRVVAITEMLGRVEQATLDKEADIAILLDKIEGVEKQAQARETELRFQRVDLVTKLAALKDALAAGMEPHSLPGGQGAASPGDTPSIIAGYESLEAMRADTRSLAEKIGRIDQMIAAAWAEIQPRVEAHKDAMRAAKEKVRDLELPVIEVERELEETVRAAAQGRDDLRDYLTALAELGRAIARLNETLAAAEWQ